MFGERLLFPRNFQPQFFDNLACDFTLRCQQVGHLAIVLLAPDQFVLTDINQFGADHQIIVALRYPSDEDRTYTEFISSFYSVSLFAFISKGYTGRGYSKVWQLRQPIDKTFSQTVGKILGFSIA